jgi:hypothetical protein
MGSSNNFNTQRIGISYWVVLSIDTIIEVNFLVSNGGITVHKPLDFVGLIKMCCQLIPEFEDNPERNILSCLPFKHVTHQQQLRCSLQRYCQIHW